MTNLPISITLAETWAGKGSPIETITTMEAAEATMAEATDTTTREEEAATIITEEAATTEEMDIRIDGVTGMAITEAKGTREMRIATTVEVMGSALTEREVHQPVMRVIVDKTAILLMKMAE